MDSDDEKTQQQHEPIEEQPRFPHLDILGDDEVKERYELIEELEKRWWKRDFMDLTSGPNQPTQFQPFTDMQIAALLHTDINLLRSIRRSGRGLSAGALLENLIKIPRLVKMYGERNDPLAQERRKLRLEEFNECCRASNKKYHEEGGDWVPEFLNEHLRFPGLEGKRQDALDELYGHLKSDRGASKTQSNDSEGEQDAKDEKQPEADEKDKQLADHETGSSQTEVDEEAKQLEDKKEEKRIDEKPLKQKHKRFGFLSACFKPLASCVKN